MTDPTLTTLVREAVSGRCPEPIHTALLVHPTGRRRKVFGRKELASRLRINNALVLTPTHVRLYGLGGRSGMKLKEELGAWPRMDVRVRAERAERSSYMATIGSHWSSRTMELHLTGPGLDVAVDVRLDAGLFADDLDVLDTDDPVVAADMAGLREEARATEAAIEAFVAALAPGSTPTPA